MNFDSEISRVDCNCTLMEISSVLVQLISYSKFVVISNFCTEILGFIPASITNSYGYGDRRNHN